MNSEDTIIRTSQNSISSKPMPPKEDNTGKYVATAAAGMAMGGLMGSGATYAATHAANAEKPEETTAEAQTDNDHVEPIVDEQDEVAVAEPQVVVVHEEPKTVVVHEDAPISQATTEGQDYTGNGGQDSVVPASHTTTDESDMCGEGEVQILGVYEAEGENGQTMEMVGMTDGEHVAAVIDVDGEGTADMLWVDANSDYQVQENEVYDISSEGVQMSSYEQAYVAQQQQVEQSQQDDMYYASNDQPDYNNDVDPTFA